MEANMEFIKQILKIVFDLGMYFNIVALISQPIQIWRTKSSENVSIMMWSLFLIFQTGISLHGLINIHSTSMFLGMGGSAVVSLTTLILCLIYRKK